MMTIKTPVHIQTNIETIWFRGLLYINGGV